MPKDRDNFESLKKVHDATNLAVQDLEAENEALRKQNQILLSQVQNATDNLLIQKKIVMDNLTQSAQTEADLVKEIMELKSKIKKLEEKIIDLES